MGDRDYRVIYRVESDGSVCVVWVIGKRVDRECYDLAVARLELFTDSRSARQVEGALSALWDPLPR